MTLTVFPPEGMGAIAGTPIDPAGPGGALVDLQAEVTRISALTEDTTPDSSADFVMVGDTSASDAHKKVLIDNLASVLSGMMENTLTFGRRSNNVTGGSYLRTVDGVSTSPSASPPVIPFAGTISAATVGVDSAPGAAWDVEIQINGSTVETISGLAAATTIVDTTLTAAVVAGDRISVRNKPGGPSLDDPVVVVVLER